MTSLPPPMLAQSTSAPCHAVLGRRILMPYYRPCKELRGGPLRVTSVPQPILDRRTSVPYHSALGYEIHVVDGDESIRAIPIDFSFPATTRS